VASALDSDGQLALVLGADACLAAWADLALIRYISAQYLELLIVDPGVLI
jgi:hypothetical protein